MEYRGIKNVLAKFLGRIKTMLTNQTFTAKLKSIELTKGFVNGKDIMSGMKLVISENLQQGVYKDWTGVTAMNNCYLIVCHEWTTADAYSVILYMPSSGGVPTVIHKTATLTFSCNENTIGVSTTTANVHVWVWQLNR